jgi:carboxyl-terminal processing protease
MNYKVLIIKVIKYIIRYGIPVYLEKFNKNVDFSNIDIKNDNDFLIFINKLIQSYHKHSSIRLRYNNLLSNTVINKSTKFNYKNKIGKITLYSYDTFSESKNNIKQYTKNIIEFLNLHENELNGLIIDFRRHSGGNMWPLIDAFTRFFNNTTLFAWENIKIKFNEKKWCNLINGQLKCNQVFINNDINITYPIAIIIGNKTASAGEFVASCFINSKKVKLFGEKSAGFLSVNNTFRANKFDVNFTTKLQTSKNGKFCEFIEPDMYTTKPILEANKWIKYFDQ